LDFLVASPICSVSLCLDRTSCFWKEQASCVEWHSRLWMDDP